MIPKMPIAHHTVTRWVERFFMNVKRILTGPVNVNFAYWPPHSNENEPHHSWWLLHFHFLQAALAFKWRSPLVAHDLLPLALEQHTSCTDEILNLSAKLCALIHDLTSFHTRVFVQTALDSESALVSPSQCFLAFLRSYWDQVASLQYFLLSSDCESTWESYCGREQCPGVQGWNEREKAAALLWQTHHFAHTHHKQTWCSTVHCSIATEMAMYSGANDCGFPTLPHIGAAY